MAIVTKSLNRFRRAALTGSLLSGRPALWRMTVLVGLLLAWEAVARLGWLNPSFVSMPSRVIVAAIDLAGESEAWGALRQTVVSVGVAFVIGVFLGVSVGAAMALSSPIRKAYLGPVVFLLSTPKVLFLPILLLFFGLGQSLSIAFGAFSAFFYVVVNVVGGIDLVEESYVKMARAYQASRLAMLTDVTMPAALPGLFAALWHGIKNAFVGVLIVELWASTGGIGMLIRVYSNSFRINYVLALIFAVSAIAILGGSLWSRAESRASRWRGSGAEPAT